MSAVIRMCGNPDANLNVLLVNSDGKPQESTEDSVLRRTWWRQAGVGTSDGFMDNGFIVQANC